MEVNKFFVREQSRIERWFREACADLEIDRIEYTASLLRGENFRFTVQEWPEAKNMGELTITHELIAAIELGGGVISEIRARLWRATNDYRRRMLAGWPT